MQFDDCEIVFGKETISKHTFFFFHYYIYTVFLGLHVLITQAKRWTVPTWVFREGGREEGWERNEGEEIWMSTL